MTVRLLACRVAAFSAATVAFAGCSGSGAPPAQLATAAPATASPPSASTSSAPATVPPPTQTPSMSQSPDAPAPPTPMVSAPASPAVAPSPSTSLANGLTLAPSSVRFDLQNHPTQMVTVTKSTPIVGPLVVTYGEPSTVGISNVVVSGSTATFTLVGIAGGADTNVQAADASGATGALHFTAGLCGRPDDMAMVRLVAPADKSTGVSTTVGSVTVAIYSPSEYGSTPLPKLHVIVGVDESFESGSFAPAAGPPAGSATAPPSGGYTLTYENAALPILAAGTTYAIEPYDDACQGPHVAGSFST